MPYNQRYITEDSVLTNPGGNRYIPLSAVLDSLGDAFPEGFLPNEGKRYLNDELRIVIAETFYPALLKMGKISRILLRGEPGVNAQYRYFVVSGSEQRLPSDSRAAQYAYYATLRVSGGSIDRLVDILHERGRMPASQAPGAITAYRYEEKQFENGVEIDVYKNRMLPDIGKDSFRDIVLILTDEALRRGSELTIYRRI